MSAPPIVSGYMVVRLPTHFANPPGPLVWNKELRDVDGRLYYGFARMAWYDLYELAHHDSRAKIIETQLADDMYYGVVQSLDTARQVLAMVDNGCRRNEIVAVAGSRWHQLYGDVVSTAECKWLGWDVWQPENWSLIYDGLFRRPDLFPETMSCLNEHGLLGRETDCSKCDREYRQASAILGENGVEAIEPLPNPARPTEPVQVWRVT